MVNATTGPWFSDLHSYSAFQKYDLPIISHIIPNGSTAGESSSSLTHKNTSMSLMQTVASSIVSTVRFAVMTKQSEHVPIMYGDAPLSMMHSRSPTDLDGRERLPFPGFPCRRGRQIRPFCFVDFFVKFPGFYSSFFCKIFGLVFTIFLL